MNRYLHVIYCDDVRHEAGGKTSYMGVYRVRLITATMPVTLPKLCLVITASSSMDDPFQRLTVQILRDNDVITETTLGEEDIAKAAAAVRAETEGDDLDARAFTLNSVMTFSPFPIEEPCTLRVRALSEREELVSHALKIEVSSGQNGPLPTV